MKANNLFFFILTVLFTVVGFSQSFNYQSVVRNSAGDIVANQTISVQLNILQGGPTGTNVYNETHSVTSNAYGVISLSIGSGTTSGDFTTIDWSSQNHWLDVAIDITGGTTYVTMGTSKLQHVPYSSYANTSGDKAFSTTANVTSNAPGDTTTDDFVFGSTQLDVNGTNNPALNTRMFFDKSAGAFRAGYTSNSQWDMANVGNYSVGFGDSSMASGEHSFAMGRNANATAPYSFAFGLNSGGFETYGIGIGLNSRANAQYATAIGTDLNANSFGEIQLGQYSTYVTGSTTTFVPTDRLFVIGNGQYEINSLLDSDALVMLKNGNTTLNGELTIDGDNQGPGTSYTLPAQDGNMNQIMQTDGSGTVSWVTPATGGALPNGGNNGDVLQTDGAGNLSWTSNDVLPAGGTNGFVLETDGAGNYAWVSKDDADADATNEIELPTGGNSGQILSTDGSGVYSWVDQAASGAFSTTANVTSNASGDTATDDLLFGATTNVTTGVTDADRLFFDKSKGAFRAGRDIGGVNAFSDVNTGFWSVAFGINNLATGAYSTASGFNNTASGSASTSFGYQNTASGDNAMAFGFQNTAESYAQTSLGYYNTPVTGNATGIVTTDRLFVIGNGTGVTPSDAITILKNGNTTLNGELTIDGDNQGSGTSYTLPAQDGTANQVMQTDGSGAVTWANASGLPSGGTNGQVLSTDGSGNYSWVTDAVDDADTDATNEIELPTGGTNGQVLSTDGSGNYSWVNDATGTSAFSTTTNVTSNAPGTIATDDFVFGSSQLADNNATTDDNNRFFFDKSKGAFRAGIASGNQFDDANVGVGSVALGNIVVASGDGAVALGDFASAEGSGAVALGNSSSLGTYSVAMGQNTSANEFASTAMGGNTSAEGRFSFSSGFNTKAQTYAQTTIGSYNTSKTGNTTTWVTTDPLFIIGNGTNPGSGGALSDALVMLKNGNTTLNGSLTIDGDNQGSGASYTLPTQDGNMNQIMQTDGSGVISWIDAPTGTASSGLEQITEGGNTGWRLIGKDPANFGDIGDNAVDLSYSFGASTTQGATGNFGLAMGQRATASGVSSVAIGDGVVASDTYAVAIGEGTMASGNRSFAAGENSVASATSSTAIGNTATATGVNSMALGRSATASGSHSQAMGAFTTAESFNSFTVGRHNVGRGGNASTWVATDPLFQIGNGVDAANKSDALVMLKNGNTTLNGSLTIDGDNQGAGASYTLPTQDGATNQIMQTDGSGTVSWLDTNQVVANLNNTSVTTNALTVNNLPAFNVTSNGTAYTTVGPKEVGDWNSTHNTDLFNDGNHLNITNGRFTAPVDGLYFFSAQVRIDGMNGTSGAAYSRLMIVKNGDRQSFRNGLHSIRNVDAGTANWDTQTVSGVLKLNANDYVSVFIESVGDANFTLQIESGFNGYLVNRL